MAKKHQRYAALRYLGLLSQFGLSLILPVVLLLFGSLWLRERYGFGSWVTLAALVLSILSWIPTVGSFMRYVLTETKKGEQEE